MASIAPRRCAARDGREFIVRPLTPDDVPAILRHRVEDYDSHPYEVSERDEIDLDETHAREKARARLEHPDRLALGAFDGARLVADLGVRGVDRRRLAHHAEFGVGVLPGFRGLGIGRELVLSMLDWAAGHPRLEWIALGVWANNARAIALYRSIGFRETGRTPAYFRLGPGRYAEDLRMAIWVKPGLAPAGMVTYAPREAHPT